MKERKNFSGSLNLTDLFSWLWIEFHAKSLVILRALNIDAPYG